MTNEQKSANVTKAQIVAKVAETLGLEKAAVGSIFDTTIDVMHDYIVAGRTIQLRGHGTYGLKHRCAKKARVLAKNTTIDLPERDVPYFKPSKLLIESVNNK